MKTFSKTMLLASIVAGITFAGCKKEETLPTPTPNPATPTIASLNALFTHQGAASQYFTIDNSMQQVITGSHGTVVTFAANSFVTMSGGTVTGNVNIELKEIYDKKSMLLSNICTNAELYPSGPKEPLISGGEFYVHATQGNAELKLAPWHTYGVFLPSTTTADPQMGLFNGTLSTNGIQWGASVDSSSSLYPSSAPQGYFANCDSLDWGNADRFLNAPNYSTVTLNVSGTFDPAQIKAFAWYDNVKVVWNFYNAFNASTNEYPDHHTATGVPLHIIVISVKDGVLYTGIVATTLVGNDVLNVTMTQSDETTFANSLTALP
jgi:hypothetical protein